MSEVAFEVLRSEALAPKKHAYSRDLRGRYVSSEKSFSWLLKYPPVADWIDSYTSEETREKKLYQLEKILQAGGLEEPSELLKLDERNVKLLTRRVANWYLQKGKAVWAKQIMITMKGFMEANDRKLEFKRAERIRSPVRKKVIYEYIPNKMDVYRMANNAMPIPGRSTRQLPLQLELWIGQRSIVPGNQSSDKDQSVPGHGYEAQPVRTLILYDGTSARGCRVVERLLGYEDKGWMDPAIIGPDLCDRKNRWSGV
ncbi:hypothetical protein E6H16_04385 [Candidatus Bathyarchaeota archaeon]|nr:MAG: hypothetical protein E6H16_04385 [Candidatus Bathyarchaeota archaeon]